MLIDKLKAVSNSLQWEFNDGPAYEQNLVEFVDDTDELFDNKKKYFLLYDFNESEQTNNFGGVISTDYDCMIFLAVRSNFQYSKDERIDQKLFRKEFKKAKDFFSLCNEWSIKVKSINDKMFQLDSSLDGIMISCDISFNNNYEDEL